MLPIWTQSLHHDGSEIYVSNPLPQLNDHVIIKLRSSVDAPIKTVFIRAMLDGEFRMVEMTKSPFNDKDSTVLWASELPIKQLKTDYRFKIMTDTGAYFYTAQGVSRADSPDFNSWVIVADYEAPLWIREQVFYQIFPERFYNGDPSNTVQDGEYERFEHKSVKREWGDSPYPWEQGGSMDFFGGDLNGISQKMDYLSDLGITALYLCPIFKSGTNHRYDVEDYFTIDKHVGGDEALAELREVSEAHNIKLMLDITPNHVSFQHPWFTALNDNRHAETADYFYWDDEKEAFETWLGVPLLIKLNWGSEKLRNIMYRDADSAMQKWLKPPYSIDAWRLDVANMTGNFHAEQNDHDVWRDMKDALKAIKSDTYLLGEYFQDGTPHLHGDELDASMNYQGFNIPMRRWLGGEDIAGHDNQPYADSELMSTEAMAEQWENFIGAIPYPIALQQFNQLDSHDTTRLLHVTNEDKALAKVGLALLFAFPGTPCIYYGTEIGMTGFKDPDNRRTMIWEKDKWDSDLLNYTKQLITLRKSEHALKHGNFQVLYAEGDGVAFLRQSNEGLLIAIGYRGKEAEIITINVARAGIADGGMLSDTLGDKSYIVSNGQIEVALQHGSALLLKS